MRRSRLRSGWLVRKGLLLRSALPGDEGIAANLVQQVDDTPTEGEVARLIRVDRAYSGLSR